jgi:hypothetical protein
MNFQNQIFSKIIIPWSSNPLLFIKYISSSDHIVVSIFPPSFFLILIKFLFRLSISTDIKYNMNNFTNYKNRFHHDLCSKFMNYLSTHTKYSIPWSNYITTSLIITRKIITSINKNKITNNIYKFTYLTVSYYW